ncbi:acetyl-coenzyme A synthetase [Pilobolus umbonatus]|nr:acetyl-coenzyme A synthetase [Pilobolus umbonatus]
MDSKPYPIPDKLLKATIAPYIKSFEEYKKYWDESINNPSDFFKKAANQFLHWNTPFITTTTGNLADGNAAWFLEGELNACYNCVDRHVLQNPNKIAIIHEGDEPGNVRKISYQELMDQVCRLANVLKKFNVQKGDSVIIYMPMIPEAAFAMLACARIGALHSVVFAGFSSDSLYDRIIDSNAHVILTADEGRRGGKPVVIKQFVDRALEGPNNITNILVYRHTNCENLPMCTDRDLWWDDELNNARSYCPAPPMSSEDPLFLLYTSGSTGSPKGILHTTAGYLLEAAMTVKYIFDVHENNIFACMADIGWITGHTYSVYGPLLLGGTTVLFESTPTYPTPSRFWEVVEKHKVTHFYTAPTAIRALRRLGNEWVDKCDLSSLRVIGSVGEPINPEAWVWYYECVGRSQCAVVDTYWQTETGSIVISPLPGAIYTKPGSATVPFFGISPVILDPTTGMKLEGNNVSGVLAIDKPWPSMARTIYNDHSRYIDTYLKPYPGYYFTGDGARRDADGYYWISGRVDDVINVSGHRLSTAEIESALIQHASVAEAAVIGGQDDLTGQCIHAFCTIKPDDKTDTGELLKSLITKVRSSIGPFAKPKEIYIIRELPKTRSGKIVRRILRKIVNKEEDGIGDLSTLADPNIIQHLVEKVKLRRSDDK